MLQVHTICVLALTQTGNKNKQKKWSYLRRTTANNLYQAAGNPVHIQVHSKSVDNKATDNQNNLTSIKGIILSGSVETQNSYDSQFKLLSLYTPTCPDNKTLNYLFLHSLGPMLMVGPHNRPYLQDTKGNLNFLDLMLYSPSIYMCNAARSTLSWGFCGVVVVPSERLLY